MSMRAIELAPGVRRAALSSINDERRSVDAIFATRTPVERQDATGEHFREVLSLDPAHVDLARLNTGAPLLDSHRNEGVASIIGVVERAHVDGTRGHATLRFSKRQAVEGIWQDVRDGLIGAVSVGYAVSRYSETPGAKGQLPTRTAVKWTPFEISLVAMGADAHAHLRADDQAGTYRCEIVTGAPVVTAALPARRVRGVPTAAQLTVVHHELQRAGLLTPTGDLPSWLSRIAFDDPCIDWTRVNGAVSVHRGGALALHLRTDQAAGDFVRTLKHECQHLRDRAWLRQPVSRRTLEFRATRYAQENQT